MHRVIKAFKVHRATRVIWVRKVWGHKERKVPMVHKEHKALKEIWVHRVPVHKAYQGPMVLKDLKDFKELMEPMVLWGLKVPALKELKD